MEQITLTKEELKEIIAKEVREAINGKKPISSGAIFNKVRINSDDLEAINKKLDFAKHLSLGRMRNLNHPIPLKSICTALNQFIKRFMYKMFMTILEN